MRSLNSITIFRTFILIEKTGDGLAESGRGLTTFHLHIVVVAHSEAIHYPPLTPPIKSLYSCELSWYTCTDCRDGV